MMVDLGVDPRAIDTMSLADISSMSKALKRRRDEANGDTKKTGRQVTDEEWTQAQEMLASVSVNDASVQIH